MRDGKATVPFSTTVEAVLEDLAYYGISCDPDGIKYGNRVGIPCLMATVNKKMKNLSDEIAWTNNQSDTLRFSQKMLEHLINCATTGDQFPTAIDVYLGLDKTFYNLVQKVMSLCESSDTKHQVKELCSRFGFEPQKFDYNYNHGTRYVTVHFSSSLFLVEASQM